MAMKSMNGKVMATENTLTPGLLLTAAALLGLTGVAIGALGAHAFRPQLSAEGYESFLTGSRYQLYHALALLALALGGPGRIGRRWLGWIGSLWAGGTVCFSGSIYLLVLFKLKAIFWVTPLGGSLLIVGWFLLFLAAWPARRAGTGVPRT